MEIKLREQLYALLAQLQGEEHPDTQKAFARLSAARKRFNN
jgi:hypothetical protein